MAFNLPLPKVVADTEAGGGIPTAMNALNKLQGQKYENQIARSNAEYAPYTNYANALSHIAYSNMLPYQIQAQMMSNPMIWMALKDNPQALKAYMSSFTQSIPKPGDVTGGMNIPRPGQGNSQNVFSMLMDKLTGGTQQGQNPIQQPPGMDQPGTNALLRSPTDQNANSGYEYDGSGKNVVATPQEQAAAGGPRLAPGGIGGVVNKMTAPYTEQSLTPGKTATNETGTFSVPDASSVQAAQQAIQGITNLKPILKDISKGAEKWLAPGAKGKLALGQSMGWLKQHFGTLAGLPDTVMKQFGITDKDISDFAEWEAQQGKAVETVMKARTWPQDAVAIEKVSKIIEPIPGEGKEYGQRVARELAQLETELLPNYQQTLSSGYELPQQQPKSTKEAVSKSAEEYSKETINMQGKDPKDGKMKLWKVPQGKAQLFLDNGFKRVN